MKYFLIGVVVIALAFGGAWLARSSQKEDSDIVSKKGLHWHPNLEIYVNGEKQVIPPNIGIGGEHSSLPMGMAQVHTHADAREGVIHLEFGGMVRKSDITLGEFFRVWGKNMNYFGSNVKMLVNGVENMELANYQMQDGDKIELKYE